MLMHDCFKSLPNIHLEDLEEAPHYPPERNLLAAILARSIQDICTAPGTKESARHKAAMTWIAYSGCESWTFNWICLQLDFNADLIREYVISPGLNERLYKGDTNRAVLKLR